MNELSDLVFQASFVMIPEARTPMPVSHHSSTLVHLLDQFVRLIDVDVQFIPNELFVLIRIDVSEQIRIHPFSPRKPTASKYYLKSADELSIIFCSIN